MTEYKGDEILKLIVELLEKLGTNVQFPPYEYGVFLKMEPKKALHKLSFRLDRLRDIKNGTAKDFSFYFAIKHEYLKFQIESTLVECLNVFLNLKKEKKEIPPLDDENDLYGADKEFSTETMYETIPFIIWLEANKGKNAKPMRTVRQ